MVDAAATFPLNSPYPFACCDSLCCLVIGTALVPPRANPVVEELAETERSCAVYEIGTALPRASAPIASAAIPTRTIELALPRYFMEFLSSAAEQPPAT